jgi:hypothetical protein
MDVPNTCLYFERIIDSSQNIPCQASETAPKKRTFRRSYVDCNFGGYKSSSVSVLVFVFSCVLSLSVIDCKYSCLLKRWFQYLDDVDAVTYAYLDDWSIAQPIGSFPFYSFEMTTTDGGTHSWCVCVFFWLLFCCVIVF